MNRIHKRKKGKCLSALILSISLSLLTVFFSLASQGQGNDPRRQPPPVDTPSVFLPPEVREALLIWQARSRGLFLSDTEGGITNEGYGVIGITGRVNTHIPVQKVWMDFFIDQDRDGKWKHVETYTFEFKAEDEEEPLTSKRIEFNLVDQPPGHYYRLRSTQGVVTFDGAVDSKSGVTGAILITDLPPVD